jgi:hypothetical protein
MKRGNGPEEESVYIELSVLYTLYFLLTDTAVYAAVPAQYQADIDLLIAAIEPHLG